MSWVKWVVGGVLAVVAWSASVVLAVALAVADDEGQGGPAPVDEGDYAVEVAGCTEPDPAGEEQPPLPAPARVASGTLTNTTDERRDYRLQVQFEADDVRIDWAPAVVERLGPGETARWEAASYLDAAGAPDVGCEVAAVDRLPAAAARTDAGGPDGSTLPPVVFSTTDNVDEAGPEGAAPGGGDVGDIDAVSYICYVVNPRVPVTCGTVTN